MLDTINMSCLHYVVTATVLMMVTFPLHANPVSPGGTVAPDVFNLTGSPPLLDDITGTFNFGGGFIGSYEAVVLVDPLGVTCSECLDFAFEVSNDSTTSAFFTLGLAGFTGYTTDVGYLLGSGSVDPVSVTRGPGGANVSFAFNTDASAVIPGDSTDVLLIATDATTYDTNGVLAITGTNGAPGSSVSGQITGLLEPTFVPEPSTYGFALLGLGFLALTRKRLVSVLR